LQNQLSAYGQLQNQFAQFLDTVGTDLAIASTATGGFFHIDTTPEVEVVGDWIPACAGMTGIVGMTGFLDLRLLTHTRSPLSA
jgi:hypothetical protein